MRIVTRLSDFSSVCNSMFEAGNGTDAQLELTDEHLERSSVLSPMLDLMHGKEIVVSSESVWKFNGPFGGKDGVDEPRWGVMGAMNPANWSTSRSERTPARVTRALLRGIEKGRNRGDVIDWEVVADEFKRILQVSCDFSYYRNLRIPTGYVSS